MSVTPIPLVWDSMNRLVFVQIIGHILGAAFGAAAEVVPSWKSGFNNGNNIGGLISAILAPTGWFGKFQVVLLALSVPSACAPTMYSFGSSFTYSTSLGIEWVPQEQVSCQSLLFFPECLDIFFQSSQQLCLSCFLYKIINPPDVDYQA